jgi:hypothetical protein
MPDPIACLLAVLAAVGASTLCVLAAGATRRPAAASRVELASVIGVAAGLASGYVVLRIEPQWPPANALDRFLTIVLPATIGVELVAAFRRSPRWLVAALRVAVALATGRVLLHSSVYLNDAPSNAVWQTLIALAGAGGLLAMAWGLLLWLRPRMPGVSIPLALSESLVCGGLAVMLHGYVAGGEAALPPAAVVTGVALAAAILKAAYGSSAPISVGVVSLFALLFIGRFFGALATWEAVVVFLAPLSCWAVQLRMLRLKTPWRAVSLRLGLVSVPLFVVLGFAVRDFNRKMSPLLTGVSQSTCIESPPRL